MDELADFLLNEINEWVLLTRDILNADFEEAFERIDPSV